jgi:hypothetical protein
MKNSYNEVYQLVNKILNKYYILNVTKKLAIHKTKRRSYIHKVTI